MNKFEQQIRAFNTMYGLPQQLRPTLDNGTDELPQRLVNFKSILAEEVDEIDDIIKQVETHDSPVAILTSYADLLGDVMVYCASEMVRFGIPQEAVLDIIMDSNASKLGADGKPIYDERRKIQKGPNYWKPEPKLAAMLSELMRQRE